MLSTATSRVVDAFLSERQHPMSKTKRNANLPTTKCVASDITRSVTTGGRSRLRDEFKRFVNDRILECITATPLDAADPGEDDDTPGWWQRNRDAVRAHNLAKHQRYCEVTAEISVAFNLAYPTVYQGIGAGGIEDITDVERAAFDRWEAASRRLQPLRELVAIVRDMPDPDRDAIEDLCSRFGDRDRRDTRSAVEAYLMAAELMDEARRMLAEATRLALAVHEERVAEEPLVALAPIADYNWRTTKKPLIDTRTTLAMAEVH
ncbi:MAG: hypothetical protein M3619_25605 [Myxococcota bacterium]|nr:hypothetical protein [Myxococcota bacterium]